MKNIKGIFLIFVMIITAIITNSCSTKPLLKNSPFLLKSFTLGVQTGQKYLIGPKGDQILFVKSIGDTKDYDYYGSYYLSSIALPDGNVNNLCKLADNFTKYSFQKTGEFTKKKVAWDESKVQIHIIRSSPNLDKIVLEEYVTHTHYDAIKAEKIGAAYKPDVTFSSYKAYLIYKENTFYKKEEINIKDIDRYIPKQIIMEEYIIKPIGKKAIAVYQNGDSSSPLLEKQFENKISFSKVVMNKYLITQDKKKNMSIWDLPNGELIFQENLSRKLSDFIIGSSKEYAILICENKSPLDLPSDPAQSHDLYIWDAQSLFDKTGEGE